MYGNFVSEDGVLRKFESRVFSTVEEAVEKSHHSYYPDKGVVELWRVDDTRQPVERIGGYRGEYIWDAWDDAATVQILGRELR